MHSVHDIILIMQWDIFLNDTSLHKSQSDIYRRHAYDKNTVKKYVKCRQFIAYYVIGGSLVYIGGSRST